MKRIEFELPEFPSFSGCDELIEFMVKNYDIPYVMNAEFQGDFIQIGGFPVEVNSESIIIASPKYKGVAWLISSSPNDGWFRLSIIKDCAQLDEVCSVDLLDYVKMELIATLKGEW